MRQYMRQKKMKHIIGIIKRTTLYMIVTIVLMLTVLLLWSAGAQSRTRAAMLFDNSMYEEKEQIYQEEIAAVLKSYDCYYSGMMLTHTVDLDGNRDYRMQIHDRRFSLLDRQCRKELTAALEAVDIQDYEGNRLAVNIVLTE